MEALVQHRNAISAAGAWPWVEADWDSCRYVSGFVNWDGVKVSFEDLKLTVPEREAFETAAISDLERVVKALGPWPRS